MDVSLNNRNPEYSMTHPITVPSIHILNIALSVYNDYISFHLQKIDTISGQRRFFFLFFFECFKVFWKSLRKCRGVFLEIDALLVYSWFALFQVKIMTWNLIQAKRRIIIFVANYFLYYPHLLLLFAWYTG